MRESCNGEGDTSPSSERVISGNLKMREHTAVVLHRTTRPAIVCPASHQVRMQEIELCPVVTPKVLKSSGSLWSSATQWLSASLIWAALAGVVED